MINQSIYSAQNAEHASSNMMAAPTATDSYSAYPNYHMSAEPRSALSVPAPVSSSTGSRTRKNKHASSSNNAGGSNFLASDGSNMVPALPMGVCSVCGDCASGHHYGVFSCEACKAFFKRTVQGNIEYSCPSDDNCEISKNRRKACQACRFKKCLLVGMMKEGVRPDRVRGGRQKYHPNPVPSLLDPNLTVNTAPSEIQGMRANIIRKLLEVEPLPVNLNFHFKKFNDVSAQQEQLAAEEVNLEQVQFLALVCDQSLVETIAWCKHVPGFLELSEEDQLRLIHNSWADLFILNVAFRSVSQLQDDEPSQNFSSITFAADASLDSELLRNKPHLLNFVEFSLTTIYRVHQCKLCSEEKVLLKAMTLSCPDAIKLSAAADVEKMQDQLHDTLRDFVSSRHPGDRNRLFRLVLLLPTARLAAWKFVSLMQKISLSGALKKLNSVYLFTEMLPNYAEN